MKYKVRLTCPEWYRSPYHYSYSDRMRVKLPTRFVEVSASIKDAETLQRLNPQHEVEIWSIHDKCYLPLWFFRTYISAINHGGLRVIDMYNYLLRGNHTTPYEPSYPLESQAPKFIYRPSTNFLIKKALYGMEKRGWKPCLGVTTAELVYTWVTVFKEQMNGKHT